MSYCVSAGYYLDGVPLVEVDVFFNVLQGMLPAHWYMQAVHVSTNLGFPHGPCRPAAILPLGINTVCRSEICISTNI